MNDCVPGRTTPRVCQPCTYDGKTSPATEYCRKCREQLCKDCYKPHRYHNDTERAIKCPKHSEKDIDFYCNFHKRVFCFVCSTVEHRDADCKVEYIPDISLKFLRDIDYGLKIKRIDTFLRNCAHSQRQASDSLTSFHEACSEALKQIEKFREEINNTFERWENDLKEEVHRKGRSSVSSTQTDLEKFTQLKTDLQGIQHRVQQMKASNNTDRLFIELIQADEVVEENEKHVRRAQTQALCPFKFIRNERIVSLLKTEQKLGDLRNMSSLRAPSSCGSLTGDLKAVQKKEINVKMKHEKRTSCITGIVILSSNSIVVADYNNFSVKLVDTDTDKILSQAVLTSGPWEIAMLPDKNIVATLFDEESIEFFTTASGLKSIRKIPLYGRCHGVAYFQDKIIVSFIAPPSLHFYDIRGTLLKAVEFGNLKGMYHISISKVEGNILVSNAETNVVVKVDMDAKIVGTFKHAELETPRGLSANEDGSVFVCSKKKNAVLRVSPDFKHFSVMMKRDDHFKGIKNPCAVVHDAKNSLLYVSCNTSRDKYDNFVKVFQLEDPLSDSVFTSF